MAVGGSPSTQAGQLRAPTKTPVEKIDYRTWRVSSDDDTSDYESGSESHHGDEDLDTSDEERIRNLKGQTTLYKNTLGVQRADYPVERAPKDAFSQLRQSQLPPSPDELLRQEAAAAAAAGIDYVPGSSGASSVDYDYHAPHDEGRDQLTDLSPSQRQIEKMSPTAW